MKEKKIEAAH